jgi:hypothetical protein
MVEFPELQNDLIIRAARGADGSAKLTELYIDRDVQARKQSEHQYGSCDRLVATSQVQTVTKTVFPLL